jgi:TPP-dependent pyruvate/acetoin dehydrogenase alpha subunit
MNIVDPAHGVLGCYGIVGGSIAAATGAALALKGTEAVAVAYFGDGATNQAYFFECLNFAKVLELPVVFVCENNGYGEYTPFEAVTPGGISPRAAAMELPTTGIDGMDVLAVHAAATEIVARVRSGGGPEFVEARTYRFVGHSRSDPGKYRPEGELEQWRERDPLVVASTRLQREHGLSSDELDEIARAVESELEQAEAAALSSAFPESFDLAEFNDRS